MNPFSTFTSSWSGNRNNKSDRNALASQSTDNEFVLVEPIPISEQDWDFLDDFEFEKLYRSHGIAVPSKDDQQHQQWLGRQTLDGLHIAIELGRNKIFNLIPIEKIPDSCKRLLQISKKPQFARNAWLVLMSNDQLRVYLAQTSLYMTKNSISRLPWIDIVRLGIAAEHLDDPTVLAVAISGFHYKATIARKGDGALFDSQVVEYVFSNTTEESRVRRSTIELWVGSEGKVLPTNGLHGSVDVGVHTIAQNKRSNDPPSLGTDRSEDKIEIAYLGPCQEAHTSPTVHKPRSGIEHLTNGVSNQPSIPQSIEPGPKSSKRSVMPVSQDPSIPSTRESQPFNDRTPSTPQDPSQRRLRQPRSKPVLRKLHPVSPPDGFLRGQLLQSKHDQGRDLFGEDGTFQQYASRSAASMTPPREKPIRQPRNPPPVDELTNSSSSTSTNFDWSRRTTG